MSNYSVEVERKSWSDKVGKTDMLTLFVLAVTFLESHKFNYKTVCQVLLQDGGKGKEMKDSRSMFSSKQNMNLNKSVRFENFKSSECKNK